MEKAIEKLQNIKYRLTNLIDYKMITYDGYTELIKMTDEAMNYIHSSLQLKEKEAPTFEKYLTEHYKWYNGFYYESKEGGYFTNGQIADKYKKEVFDNL